MKITFTDLQAQYLSIKDDIDRAIHNTIMESAFILGPRLEAFEKDFALFCHAQHCVGVGSGTDALFLALKAMGVKPGDEVITVSHTYIATVEAISMTGATPIFVDIEPESMLMDAQQIESKITSKTRVIIPVHLNGQICDMDSILEIANRHGLQILEDCAQSHGAEYHGKRCPVSTTAAFSFYPGKNLGCYGDGGAVVTHNKSIADYIKVHRDHGRPVGSKYEHDEIGFGYRLDTLQAAILHVKLPHLERWTELRRQHANNYTKQLSSVVKTPVELPNCKHVYHIYPIRVPNREALQEHLKQAGIPTIIHYPIPVHLQKAYASLNIPKGSLPVTEQTVKEILSLPIFPELRDEQINFICSAIIRHK